MNLRFRNWDRFNRRAKEYKNPVWFSFQNDFATNRDFFDFTDQERLIFIYLLCEASAQNRSGEFSIELDHFSYHTRQKQKDILSAISKLEQKQILEPRDRDGIVSGSYEDRDLAVTEQNRTEHNRTEQNTFASSDEKSLSHPKAYESVVDVFNQRGVKPSTTSLWETAYPDSQWVVQEIRKALAWEGANAKRKKRDFARFMTNWLNNGWDRRRIDAPRQQTTKGFRPSTERTNDLDLEIFGDKK